MFKSLPKLNSLPQAIGLPFLSSQEDAQLKFKSGTQGIKRLYADEIVPATDVAYWSNYYTLFNSTADVSSLISVQDVRQAIQNNPSNLSTLILFLSHHLFTLIPSPAFPNSPPASGQDLAKEALNCLRVLGHVLVVVYESEADIRDRRSHGITETEESFGEKYLWKKIKLDPAPASLSSADLEAEQFKIEDSDDEGEASLDQVDEGAKAFSSAEGHPARPASPNESKEPIVDPLTQAAEEAAAQDQDEDEYLPCLVDRLFSCVIDLLFCAGFTLPESVRGEAESDKINYVIWEKGVGSTVSIGSSAHLDRNKTEILRFLLILLSTPIYTPPHLLLSPTTPSIPLSTLTHSLEKRLVLSLLCSFLNTSLSKNSNALAGLGNLGVGGMVGKGAEERKELVRSSMMVLLVALDYRVEPQGMGQSAGEGKDDNAFRYFISKLHRKEDFTFILDGIFSILQDQGAGMNGYLPGPKKSLPYILETYILMWRLIDLNKRFRQHLLSSSKSLDLMVHLLLTSLELKDDPSNHGLLRLLAYLLQTLSADAEFAKGLNQTIRMSVPGKWAVGGSAADFMIVSIYSIATTPGLNPLFPALTISISNISPYLQNISVQASSRLIQLFKAFKAPGFLLGDEGHPRLVYYLLECFNNVLYHGLAENPNLIYAILRSHNDFQSLGTFTLFSGLREIQRRKALRAAVAERTKSVTASATDDPEKSGLLANGNAIDSPDDDRSILSVSPPMASPGTTGPLVQSATDLSLHPPPPHSRTLSEKARGKMRATESTASLPGTANGNGHAGESAISAEEEEELLGVAQSGVGLCGFVPTQEWVSSWQKGLPLDPVLLAISELLPQIQESQSTSTGGTVGGPSEKVFGILKGVDLQGVLPDRGTIVPRKFTWSPASQIWLTSLLWGNIYVAGLTSAGTWKDTQVRLFGIKQAAVKDRGMGRVLKMIGVV